MKAHDTANFIVIGAGIGGLAAALALSKRGYQVLILESAPTLGEIGAGIQLAPNALRVLDELGLLEDVYRNAVYPPKGTMRDAVTGTVLGELDFGEGFIGRYGYPYIVTHRADLHGSLLRSCQKSSRVILHTDRAVDSIRESDGIVTVTTDGGHTYRGEVVVGADGLHSVVRQYVVGDGAAESSGDVAYRGTVPIDQIPDRVGKDHMTWWVGPHMHLIQYPVRGGKLFNQVAVIARDSEPGAVFGSEADLDRLFVGKYEDVEAGVALMGRDQCWDLFDRQPATNWTKGRVTLLGDAAHPMLQYLAQGGCQALEDAIILAASFGTHPDNIDQALSAYQTERAPRTAKVQTWARRVGEIVHADGTLALLRNELLAQRVEDDFAYVDWLYNYRRPDHLCESSADVDADSVARAIRK